MEIQKHDALGVSFSCSAGPQLQEDSTGSGQLWDEDAQWKTQDASGRRDGINLCLNLVTLFQQTGIHELGNRIFRGDSIMFT